MFELLDNVCVGSPVNIKNGWEKKGNRGLAVFSYSIPSQLIISETLANLGHRESIKIMVLKTHENRRKSQEIAENRVIN